MGGAYQIRSTPEGGKGMVVARIASRMDGFLAVSGAVKRRSALPPGALAKTLFAAALLAGACDGSTTQPEPQTPITQPPAPALVITTTTLPEGVKGVAYSVGLNAIGGRDGYTWSVEAGSPPAGLALSEAGILSGVPQTSQVTTFTVRVRSEDGQRASKSLTMTVAETASSPVLYISTIRIAPAVVGETYAPVLKAQGGDGSPQTWSVVSGTLPPGVQLSAGGVFSGRPTTAGSYTITVRVTAGGKTADIVYTLVVVANDASRFNITAVEVAAVEAVIKPHLDAAIARWEAVIKGDLSNTDIPAGFFSATFCGGFGEVANGTTVEDIIVLVDIAKIDGVGEILGQAGACGVRQGNRLPFVGVLTLDSDDLKAIAGTQTLTDLLFHEIGHILGFGGLWGSAGLSAGAGTPDSRFTGASAVAEYQKMGPSATSIPLENLGGAGTADVHWRESVFRTEIMTGFTEPIGVKMPLSRVTIGSFADLGYGVDYGAADTFTLSPLAPAPPGSLTGPRLGRDVVLIGPVRTLP
jgi:hypothetical protein